MIWSTIEIMMHWNLKISTDCWSVVSSWRKTGKGLLAQKWKGLLVDCCGDPATCGDGVCSARHGYLASESSSFFDAPGRDDCKIDGDFYVLNSDVLEETLHWSFCSLLFSWTWCVKFLGRGFWSRWQVGAQSNSMSCEEAEAKGFFREEDSCWVCYHKLNEGAFNFSNHC